MKRLISWSNLVVFGMLLLVIGCKGDKAAEKKVFPIPTPSESEEEKAVNIKKLSDIKKKFACEKDDFKNLLWCTHKTQTTKSSYNRTFLRAHVNGRGYMYLESQYYGSSWIFHEKMIVKAGDLVVESNKIPTHSENNRNSNYGGSVWEHISYVGGADNGAIKLISNIDSKTRIKVRLEGRQRVHDFVLASKDVEAIKDAVQLSELLKKYPDK